MSRSRKKIARFKDNSDAGEKRSWKKIFNRRLRRSGKYQDIPSGSAYKKLQESWYICDYSFEPDWDDPESVRRARMK